VLAKRHACLICCHSVGWLNGGNWLRVTPRTCPAKYSKGRKNDGAHGTTPRGWTGYASQYSYMMVS
jgi:hypothetical protein